jgi:hypothetical protein
MALNMLLSVPQISADSTFKIVVIGENDYLQVRLYQINDSLDFRITNKTSDTLRYYLGFYALDSARQIYRFDYNMFHNTRPLGGKFATRSYSILPGETLFKRQRIAPKMYDYLTGFYGYTWFVGIYSRREKYMIELGLN